MLFKFNSFRVKLFNKFLLITLIIISYTQLVQAQEIIPCRCTVGQFDGLYGYVNQDDEIITPLAHYGSLDPFEGYGRVTNKNEWGLVDSTGALKVPVEFQDVQASVNEDIAVVTRQNVTTNYKKVLGLYSMSKHDTITGFHYRTIQFYGQGNLFMYSKFVDDGVAWGLLNHKGEEVFQTEKGEYLFLNKPHSSKIFIHLKNGQQTYVDSTGRFMFPEIRAEKCSNFYDGYAFLCKSDGCFKIDTLGNLTALKFDDILIGMIEGSSNGQFAVFVQDGKHGVIDYTGKVIVEPKYETIYFCRNEFSFIGKMNGQSVLIDSTGQEVPGWYDRIHNAGNGYFSVVKGEKVGLIDRSGNIIFDLIYDGTMMVTEEGACVAKLGDNWGLVDLENNVLIPFENHSMMAREGYIKYQRMQYGPPTEYVYVYKTDSGEIKLRKLDKHNAKPCVFK